MSGPLDGIRVIETATYLSGPFAGLMLADLGAEVIKVEPPDGDPWRTFARPKRGTSGSFLNVNHSKKSVVLDLKSESGRATFLRLVSNADVLLENWRPGVAAALGITAPLLGAANPRLVRLSISGYGPDGPLAHLPVFDGLLQARTGLARAQGGDGKPQIIRTTLVDKVTSMMAAQAILAALLKRSRTGVGEHMTLSMLDATAYFNAPDLFDQHVVVAEDSHPKRRMVPPPTLATLDGYLVVNAVTGRQLTQTCDAVGHPEWKKQLKGTPQSELAKELNRHLRTVLPDRTTSQWLRIFEEHDVPAAPVLTIDEHLSDPQVRHNAVYSEIDDPRYGAVRVVRYPAKSDRPLPRATPCPSLGEHTREVLR